MEARAARAGQIIKLDLPLIVVEDETGEIHDMIPRQISGDYDIGTKGMLRYVADSCGNLWCFTAQPNRA